MGAGARLRASGVTIILTTHYIDEAEEMAERIGVINKGELVVVEEKAALMKKLGKKQLTLHLLEPLDALPPELADWKLRIKNRGSELEYTFDASEERTRHPGAPARAGRARHRLPRPETRQSSLEDIFIDLVHQNELPRRCRDLPLRDGALPAHVVAEPRHAGITTSLYFVVFGAAIGARMGELEGVPYGAFIVPGLIMLAIFTESLSNASFGIYLPKFTGTIFEVLSAPVSAFELVLAYVGAAATKSVLLGLVILATANVFVPVSIAHPLWMIAFLVLTATTFCLFGFVLGIWADGFDQLQFVPMLVITPLTFLGGAFYSIDMLPQAWRAFSLFNPIVYLISGFRWTFYGTADVPVGASLAVTAAFFLALPRNRGLDLQDRLPAQDLTPTTV